MHNFIRTTALVVVLAVMAAPAAAATPGEFYLNLLRRGVTSYDANRYPDAAKQLHIAAFGLVDAVEQYQLAQMYLALTHDKLGEKDRAREAAHRVVVAERVERRYAAATVPAAVRSAFETLAGTLLTPADLAILRGGPIPVPQTVNRPAAAVPQTSVPPRTAPAVPQTTTRTAAPQTTVKPPAPQPVRPQVTTPAPQTTTPENTAPQTITPPVPAPAKPKPEPAIVKPATKPPATTAAQTPVTGGSQTSGRGGPVEPARPAAPAPRALSATEVSARLAAAERALNGANLNEARRGYRELLGAPGIDHGSLMRIAEGLYRARDFAAALNAFNRIGALRRGEEPYRYYVAVAAYETGDYARAKKELGAALPYIEITPDVARYRTRIEGAQ
jgi:hypothetical protein